MRVVIRVALPLLIWLPILLGSSAFSTRTQAQEMPVVRRVEEIHKMPYEDLFRGVQVDLECIVAIYEPDWAILFVHDGTFGMYAGGTENLPLKMGDRIRIRGLLGTNRVPVNCTYEPSNNNIQLPDPKRFDFEHLAGGRDDSQYGQIEGQLVGIGHDHHQTTLEMRTSNGGRFRGMIHGSRMPTTDLEKMLGRKLRLRGMVGSRFDQFNRWSGFQIWVGDQSNIEQVQGLDEPETIPISPISELNADKIIETKSSYFRTQGVVSFQMSEDMVLLQDQTHQLFVELQSKRPVTLDRFYEISGSLDTSIEPAILRMAEIQVVPEKFKVSRTALQLPMDDLMSGEFSGRLVQTSGVYSGPFEIERGKGFFLRSKSHMLPVFVTDGNLPEVASGTNVEVDGIWVQQKSLVGFNIGSCALYARQNGIHVGSQTPWVVISILGIVGCVAILSSAWAVTLRRQVRKKTQEVLDSIALQRKTEEQYANIFINARVMVMTTDAAGHITAVNPAAVRQTRRREPDLIGLHVTELVEQDSVPALKDLLSRAVATDQRFSCEVRLSGSQGMILPLEVNCWGTHHDQITTLHLIWHDISERLRIAQERSEFEQQMVSMQKMESLGVLAGGIAHDFNNLLTVILGNASLLHSSPQMMFDDRNSLESIQNAASRAAELTQQMLAYAGRGKFDVRVLDLSSLIREMYQLLVASISKTSQLVLNLDDKLPTIRADVTQLKQIMMNLVLNASESMDGKPGVIRIATSVAPAPVRSEAGSHCVCFSGHENETHSELGSPSEFVMLEVIDEGCGMMESVMERILDPFFTTKFSGRGLGLSTVVGIVRSHRGCLVVQSEVGRGSTFRVYLPVDRTSVESRTPEESVAQIPERTAHVLVVDDEPSVLMLMKRTMEHAGFQVTPCASPVEALDFLRDGRNEFDCLVTDITMPVMDGLELSRAAQALKPELPIVLCSGFSVSLNQHEAQLPGLYAFLKKPFQTRELTNLVSRVISDARARAFASGK